MKHYYITRAVDVRANPVGDLCANQHGPTDARGCYEVLAYPKAAPSYPHHHGFGDDIGTMVDVIVRMSQYHRDYYAKYAMIMIVDRCTLKVVWRDSGLGIMSRL